MFGPAARELGCEWEGQWGRQHRNYRCLSCVLQCVAVHCSVLQCVAVCCSVLQCVRGTTATSQATSGLLHISLSIAIGLFCKFLFLLICLFWRRIIRLILLIQYITNSSDIRSLFVRLFCMSFSFLFCMSLLYVSFVCLFCMSLLYVSLYVSFDIIWSDSFSSF